MARYSHTMHTASVCSVRYEPLATFASRIMPEAALHRSALLHHIHQDFPDNVTIVLFFNFKWLSLIVTPETPVTRLLTGSSTPLPYEIGSTSEGIPARVGGP